MFTKRYFDWQTVLWVNGFLPGVSVDCICKLDCHTVNFTLFWGSNDSNTCSCGCLMTVTWCDSWSSLTGLETMNNELFVTWTYNMQLHLKSLFAETWSWNHILGKYLTVGVIKWLASLTWGRFLAWSVVWLWAFYLVCFMIPGYWLNPELYAQSKRPAPEDI